MIANSHLIEHGIDAR